MNRRDAPTQLLYDYVKKEEINVAKMARATGIPYFKLIDSLKNENRSRSLTAEEFVKVRKYLGIPIERFEAALPKDQ